MYIEEKILNSFKLALQELQNRTDTNIVFDFDNQCFDVKGYTAESVNLVTKKIVEQLFPKLDTFIDKNYMKGTYESSFSMKNIQYALPESPKPKPAFIQPQLPEKEPEKREKEGKGEDLQMVVEKFTISPRIHDIKAYLTGPPQHNMINAEYLDLIGAMTETECHQEGRTIIIKGYSQKSVNEALKRFEKIQKTFVGCHKTNIIPCLHYPVESEPYKLFFCPLTSYKYKHLIPLSNINYYVLLPVFYNREKQDYDIPKDMIPPKQEIPLKQEITAKNSTISSRPASPTRTNISPHLPTEPVTPTPAFPTTPTPQPRPFAHTPSSFQNTWGLDRDFKNVYSTNNAPYLTAQSLSKAFQSPPLLDSPLLFEDFPTLDTPALSRRNSMSSQSSTRSFTRSLQPTLSKRKTPQHRVLRIVPQKAISSRPQRFSQLQMAKEYNFKNIKRALEEGFDAVQGHKGEVTLSAKVTNRAIMMDEICCILPMPLKRKSFYEFHCSARNQRREDYKNVVMHMKEGIIQVTKVVYSEKTVTEIDWASLGRKLDFQMSLKVRELIRTDVKPFTTFANNMTINPVTQVMTFEEIENFLNVKYILYKQTSMYKINHFMIEVTRVEKLALKKAPMNLHQTRKQIMAEAEGQEVWFEVEVFDSRHDTKFDLNKDIEIGSTANWATSDLLGDECQNLGDMVAFVLTFIEKAEEKMKAAIKF
ncbi:hypothetical protein G6F56_000663 [Rhizopus delemar]|nr:hypothetical protein G6F56_000663 [Rhizopus delemar]